MTSYERCSHVMVECGESVAEWNWELLCRAVLEAQKDDVHPKTA